MCKYFCLTLTPEVIASFKTAKDEAEKKAKEFCLLQMFPKKGKKIKRTAAQRKGWIR